MTSQIKGTGTSTFGGNVDVTGIVITDMPIFAMTNSGSNQSIPDNSATKVTLDTVLTDTNNAVDTVNSKIVIPSGHGGIYQINYALRIDSGANSTEGITLAYLYINGTRYSRSYNSSSASQGRATHHTRSQIIQLLEGDELELYAQCDSTIGASPIVNFGVDYTELSGFRIR